MPAPSRRLRALSGVPLTLLILYLLTDRLAIAVLLLATWAILFRPIELSEGILFVLAALFFLVQNYVCLNAGLFEFRDQDILLMPLYEPLLWGFYFVSLKRFVEPPSGARASIDARAIGGLAATSAAFSLFSHDSRMLFAATTGSTLLLLALFHSSIDLAFAVSALVLGFVIELFGVSSGLWKYPAPDFLGIPFWFVTMWVSVGLLAWRFAMPAAAWLAEAGRTQRE